jgi:hypothetical protein
MSVVPILPPEQKPGTHVKAPRTRNENVDAIAPIPDINQSCPRMGEDPIGVGFCAAARLGAVALRVSHGDAYMAASCHGVRVEACAAICRALSSVPPVAR